MTLDEREAIARAATPGDWEIGKKAGWNYLKDDRHLIRGTDGFVVGDATLMVNAAHIAANDPQTVLADLATMRKLRARVIGRGNRASMLELRVTELEARVALAQRIIDAAGALPTTSEFCDLLELWEHGPKEVHLN